MNCMAYIFSYEYIIRFLEYDETLHKCKRSVLIDNAGGVKLYKVAYVT
jgi:hypothetical protein